MKRVVAIALGTILIAAAMGCAQTKHKTNATAKAHAEYAARRDTTPVADPEPDRYARLTDADFRRVAERGGYGPAACRGFGAYRPGGEWNG